MEKIAEQFKEYTILCVEDEEGIKKRLVNTLRYYFKEVYEASDGEEGYEIYYEYKPDIIISDIQMPKENGIKMIEKIRKKDSSTIVVMLTAYSSEEYLLSLINLNINHYILKPINAQSLLEGIVKAFGNRLFQKLNFRQDMYFDMRDRELYYKDEIVSLRKRDKEFLVLLYENKNQVLTYEQIEEYIWKDRSMSMSALKTFIKEFRQRLPFELLENISQVGYKLKI